VDFLKTNLAFLNVLKMYLVRQRVGSGIVRLDMRTHLSGSNQANKLFISSFVDQVLKTHPHSESIYLEIDSMKWKMNDSIGTMVVLPCLNLHNALQRNDMC